MSADSYSNQGLRTGQSVSQSKSSTSVRSYVRCVLPMCAMSQLKAIKREKEREWRVFLGAGQDGSASHNVWHDDDDDERTGMS